MDHRIDGALLLHDAANELAEETRIGRPQCIAFDITAQAVRLELRDNGLQRRAADIHLIKRLNGGKPRRAVLVGALGHGHEVGLEPEESETEGGPFSVIAYCWTQALQFFPEDEREKHRAWFEQEHFPQLMEWDRRFTENHVRPHTRFPMSFSVTARKPS